MAGALAACIAAMLHWHDAYAGIGGAIWKQVAASTAIYGAFLGVLLAAFILRARLWPR